MALESTYHIQPCVVFELNHMALKMTEKWSERKFDSQIREPFKRTTSNESRGLIVVNKNKSCNDEKIRLSKEHFALKLPK